MTSINQGQLKNIARAACDELNANLPGGAGEVINDLISSWQVPVTQTEDFAVVTQGQLKALAAPFYERLTAAGLADGLPWASATTPPQNYAPANKKGSGVNNAWQKKDAGRFLTACPAVLVECGFITSSSESVRLKEAGYRDRLASGIARGVVLFLQTQTADKRVVASVVK